MQDWTHKKARISDIRKLHNLYAITTNMITTPILIKDTIFNERIESYFLKDHKQISREEILGVNWKIL